ncbi:MAG: hypothetical protein IJ301_03970 [Clostridia bacterium]|nr:hypothetical protein [Clostridia bacterium]
MDYESILESIDDEIALKRITDERKIKEYNELLDNQEALPENVLYKTREEYISVGYEYKLSIKHEFYEVKSLEEVELSLKMENTRNLKNISNNINFFKVLTVVNIIISITILILSFIIGLS